MQHHATGAGVSATDLQNSTTTGRGWATIITDQPFATNSEQNTESEAKETTKKLLDQVNELLTVFGPVFEAVSVLLTGLSTYIYSLPNMRCPTAKYLIALNGVDSIAGFIITLFRTWQNTDSGATSRASFHYVSMFGALFVTVACKRMVYCFTLLLSVERFFVIAFPVKSRYVRIVHSPKLVIAILVLAVQTYHVYLPLKYQVRRRTDTESFTMTHSALYLENRQVFENLATAAKVLFSYVPLVLCLALSVTLVVALRRHGAARRSLQEKRHSDTERADGAERQLATTIWVSSLLFALLSLPSNTVQVVASFHPEFRFLGRQHHLYLLLRQLASLCLVATRYTNFLAYLSLSTAFRRNLLRLLACKKVEPPLLTVTRPSRLTMTVVSGSSASVGPASAVGRG
ncbi:uncharacterized protein LOC143280404 [Babylonia areolata]|uniref:uncharacterized protein LOC143280404 n=1 Tax=Babylonia areolata TaxID=304850 RepID=UPI003FD0B110